jgi:hypothetical protein
VTAVYKFCTAPDDDRLFHYQTTPLLLFLWSVLDPTGKYCQRMTIGELKGPAIPVDASRLC